jgi:two-component system, NtrC family, response regulator HydG
MTGMNCSSPDDVNEEVVESKNRDVLLVDDESELLLLVGDLLRAKGFDVITAPDAGRAMEQLDEHKVRVVVLDVNLAGEDGVRFMSFIKMNHPDVPVLLYTGLSHDESQVKMMLEQGATCYVNKNQPPAALFFAVQQVMEIH